jgi:hypothetical protein
MLDPAPPQPAVKTEAASTAASVPLSRNRNGFMLQPPLLNLRSCLHQGPKVSYLARVAEIILLEYSIFANYLYVVAYSEIDPLPALLRIDGAGLRLV